ncbi:MAG: hypothetical protein AAGC81_07500 [Pseudomonadota bacterium]
MTTDINAGTNSGAAVATEQMDNQAEEIKEEVATYDTTAMEEMMNTVQSSSNLNIMTSLKMNMIQFEQGMMTTILRGLQWK